jgi:hypothetical protein
MGHTPRTIRVTGYGNVALAGALQVLYDLNHASGPDADDAARAWLDWMLSTDAVV